MNSHAKVVTGTLTRRTISLLKDGAIELVVSEPPVVFGRAGLQYTVRLLNGEQLPHTIPGIMPFPVAMVPNFLLTPANIGSYDVTKYTCRRRDGRLRNCSNGPNQADDVRGRCWPPL